MIRIDSLTQRYGSVAAVDDVSFAAFPGRVTGFLGPNGAGKSTTLRALTGLSTPTAGRTTVLGHRYQDLPNPGLEVGVLLDASAQHGGRTGRETLVLAQRTMGLPAIRVDEMLDLVGLTWAEGKRRVRDYSLGMRQRLGIATALMGDPRVLVLDEPANGLDPAGIRWMRDLLRGFADDGGTVLLSSHLLSEIEMIADDIIMIGHGRIVASGATAELLAGAGTLVRSDDGALLADALVAAGFQATPRPDGAVATDADPATAGQVAFRAGLPVTELRTADGHGLEEMFLELTAADQREGATSRGIHHPNGAAA
ncbi:ATP-binding cassette domain-containing protein [Isoptericola sp. S6320L]|uniref:ABC transporter ATP-binding protein n=1 Tax=Isoptericola sp. S6320L TaxID=2926411 RepID=UPI001FF11462|nr:ATP-binding cassette domain-containing protein [Isoptericola sp. S6320L]MCK0118721.1 ATP-binding cassette domain-containing protein [Isoptericola sp. S6320L]